MQENSHEAALAAGENPGQPFRGLINLEKLIESAYNLEPLPPSVPRLAALCVSENANVDEIADVISFDPVLTGKLLGAANSAYASRGITITDVPAAVVRMGRSMVLSLAVASSIRTQVQEGIPEYGLAEGELWEHSVMAALAVESAKEHCTVSLPPECFTAAILHDIGKLSLSKFLTEKVVALFESVERETQRLRYQIEYEFLEVHHGEVGALIAQYWGLPDCIVQGIMHHHEPEMEHPIVSHVVHLVDEVAKAAGAIRRGEVYDPSVSQDTMAILGIEPEGIEKLTVKVGKDFEETSRRFQV